MPNTALSPADTEGAKTTKAVLVVWGVLIGLGIVAVAAVVFGIRDDSRAVRIESEAERARIAAPTGGATAGGSEWKLAELGLPIYPGAQQQEQASARLGTPDDGTGPSVFYTTDSPEQVLEFYRDSLGSSVDVVETPQGGLITSVPGDQEGFMIAVARDEDNARTVISIIRGIAAP